MWTINRADADADELVSCRNKNSPRESDGMVERLLLRVSHSW